MGLRRKGRELALQTLYALSFEEMDEVLGELAFLNIFKEKMTEIIGKEDTEEASKSEAFAENILSGVLKYLTEIDNLIVKHLDNWSFERVTTLDKNLLRIAVYELLKTETPAPIIVNEAIEIAKRFCSENSGKFINGILNAVAGELELSFEKATGE